MSEILDVLQSEFSDLPNLAALTRISVRLVVASLLGGLLGWDRTQHGKAAGLRTYMFVAAGSALLVIVPQQVDADVAAISRIVQGLTAGIGFLGAGAIIKREQGAHIIGLTTAAGIWMTAAIGVAAGWGRESTAIVGTLLALAILKLMPIVEHHFGLPEAAQGRAAAEKMEQQIETHSE